MPELTADQIRTQRDRVLASRLFARSKRQSDFLDYIVNAALEGRADNLKEFTIGIDVFEKNESFDPTVDSLVRVEAGRLRSKLCEYYVGEGQNDAVHIDIPKGHYVPVFTTSETANAKRHGTRRQYLWAGLCTAILVLAIVLVTARPPVKTQPSPEIMRSAPPNSIAVLPLRDWSIAPQEHFSEALTDALISSLATIRPLRVTSLTSVMQFNDTETPIPEIGKVLNVSYIVEGSVFRDGENVRINAQLISAEADTHIWAKTYDRPAAELMVVQNEVAAEIAAQISKELSHSTQTPFADLNPAAYEAYLKGKYFYNKFTANGFRRSMTYFQEAIDIEPGFAKAYAGLASCHCLLAGHGLEMVSPVVALPESQLLAKKALILDPGLAEPIAFLGIIDFKYGWDVDAAEARLEQAIEINPSLFQAYIWRSQIMEAMLRHEEAIDSARHAKQLNPLSLAAGLNLGWQLYQSGNYIEAATEIDDLVEFDDAFWGGHWAKGHIHNQHGMYHRAIVELEQAVSLRGGHSLPLSALGYTYAKGNMPDEAKRVIAELTDLAKDSYVSPFHVAVVYAGLGDADEMFDWLDRAYQVRARSLAWLHVTREMRPYHDDPRFQDLLNRIGVYRSTNR